MSSDAIQPRNGANLIECGEGWEAMNRNPFIFRHRLADHPLFQIPQLVNVADRVVERGDTNKWIVVGDKSLDVLPGKERLSQALSRIEEGETWLKMSSLHEIDPAYDELLRTILTEMEELTGLPIQRTMTWRGITVFVASPKKVTPYHFDHDTNFLFQIKGDKDVYLFDSHDRSVLTEEEIELFYAGNPMAGKYRADLENRGALYRLSPGAAVHQPPLAPHLIINGNNVSVSVSIFFSFAEADSQAKVYQANYCLRKLGLRPTPPGNSSLIDGLKIGALSSVSKRRPKTQNELLYSGFKNITNPFREARKLVQERGR